MTGPIQSAAEQVLWGCKTLCARGYVLGTAGNVSARVEGEDLFVITPTSLPYDELTAGDLVVVDLEGRVTAGSRAPSVECGLHRRILLARPDARCIVHTHSKFATAVSAMQNVSAVPVIDIETAMYIGGDIAVAPFAPPGSEDLARNAAFSLGDRAGVIMEGHGAIGVGLTMQDAMIAADNVERTCELFCIIRAAGEIKPLPEAPLRELCAWSREKRGVASGRAPD
ncbi:conserved hypothetical protein [uncultured delta proteobacterium]|uniref:Class II aldolase/adducin N-terminal domain-containing protein n=1 Tax=uncultured delta proteobacterium TaxID=34034 RepID=A0A212K498_9DELT|nr:conserved hypothetical protein [uncultured delta proteobacterium]